jgi:hypothetical protein
MLVLAVFGCSFLLTGCFGSSSSGNNHDSGTLDFDSSTPALDSSTEDVTQHDSSVAMDAPADTFTADVVVVEDAPEEAPPATMFSTSPVSFGLANCGGQPTPATQSYTFTNSGPLPITWSAAVGTTVFAIQGPSSGTVAPGAMGTITVGVTSVPATSTAGTPLDDTLTITTNVPGYTTVLVPLTVTPQGGTLTVAALGFGSVTAGSTSSLPLALQNVGNGPVSVTIGAPTDAQFGITYTGSPGAATVPGGMALPAGTATFTPSAVGLQSATASVTVTGVLCGAAAPTSITLSGTGTASALGVGPSPLSFGTVSCGSTAAPLALTLTNSNAVALPYTTSLALGASSPYSLDKPTGTVPANGKAVINVTPQGIQQSANLTPGFYNDTLTVTGQGLAPITVPIQESAGGAILTLTAAKTGFGTVANTSASLPFTVTNTGNQDTVGLTLVAPAGFSAAYSGAALAAADGGTATGNVTFTATSNATVTGTLGVSATNVCDPVAAGLTFTATGEVPVTSFPKGQGPFAVGFACGSGAATTAQFQVKNAGQAPLTIVNPVSVNGYFTFTGFTSPIAAGASDTVTVTAVQNGLAGSATAYADQLRFSTNEVGAPVYNVAVNDTVTGANIVVTPSTIDFTSCNNVDYNVVVTGVLPAGVAATIQGNTSYCVGGCFPMGFGAAFDQGNPPVSVKPGNSYPDTVYSNENSNCMPETVTFLTATGPICKSTLFISGTYTSPGACTNCGADHS